MAVRLHRRPGLPLVNAAEDAGAAVPAETGEKERRREERRVAPVLAFPTPPTVRLEIPRPLDRRNWRDYLLLGLAAALGGAMLCGLAFAGRLAFGGHDVVLEGVVAKQTRIIAAGSPGVLHRVVAPGAQLDTGAVLATIAQPVQEAPPQVETRTVKRMAESLRRAELVLADARKQQTAIEELRRQERATHAETDEAAAEVRRRQMERDRAAEALSRATARPEVPVLPPHRVLADAPMIVDSLNAAEGEAVAADQTIATVTSPQTRVEAPLGKTSAPEEGAPVMLLVGGVEIPGRLEGIHVEGITRTITVVFQPPATIPAGTHLPVRIIRAGGS